MPTASYTLPKLNYNILYFWMVDGIGPYQFTTRGPLSVSITGPTCLNNGDGGRWDASVSGNEGTVHYSWSYSTDNGITWTNVGIDCVELAWTMPNYTANLKCSVNDALTLETAQCAVTVTLGCSGGGGTPSCPFAFTWDGAQIQEDNNLIPQSEDTTHAGMDVTDYYLLRAPLKTHNGRYVLQIREFEHERSHLDQFQLFAVDHPSNINIALTDSGEIIPYVTPHKLLSARLRGKDVTSRLHLQDTLQTFLDKSDTLFLSFEDTSRSPGPQKTAGTAGGVVGAASTKPKNPSKISAFSDGRSPLESHGSFMFRLRPTLFFMPLSTDSLTNLKIVFGQRVALRYINYAVRTHSHYQQNQLRLLSAVHSVDGDVTSLLASTDNGYALLEPGQSIELQFNSSASLPGNTSRDFILMTRGRYETLSDSSGNQNRTLTKPGQSVSSFQLHPNYPNPFNPRTDVGFQVAEPGMVTLKIYNTLGEEIATLVNDNKEAGEYTVSWDASGQPSGLYFCHLVVIDSYGKVKHSEMQKMLLLR